MIKKILCVVFAVLLCCIFTGCGTEREDVNAGNSAGNTDKGYAELGFSDIYGKEYPDIFSGHKVTMVNLFATWCGPCVREIPELQLLHEKYYGSDELAVVGIVTDTYYNGSVDTEVVDAAKSIAEQLNVSYPFLIPDETNFNGYIDTMMSYPETLFIDGEGHILRSVIGSNDFDGWSDIIDEVMASIEK